MKTAKPPAPDGVGGSSRRQPLRQTRVNPPRTSSLSRANPLASAPASEQPINILPGITHFADAITALPKELVRHFTLLKEVDAKIFAPEAALFQLLESAVNIPVFDFARPLNDASSSAASVSAPMSSTGAANPAAPASDGSATSVFDPANIPRRTIFRDTALKIQEMLVSLEEKNHVIATANDALQKQLSRIEEIWPHLEAELSDEAKWGSTTHWAYVENRQAKANDKQAERSRREGAATLSAAAQALAEEAAARSSDRKQALAAKKNSKNQADADGDKAQDTGKKAQGGKSRKPLPDSGPVGLGITAPTASAPANKRRKVEAKQNGATPAERAMGSVFGSNASKQRTTSPRETPAPESGNKKRKALPTSSNQAKKRQVHIRFEGTPQATTDHNVQQDQCRHVAVRRVLSRHRDAPRSRQSWEGLACPLRDSPETRLVSRAPEFHAVKCRERSAAAGLRRRNEAERALAGHA
jgi:ditrans,polycis-polyprenyl diphosphate synthase